MFKKFLSKMGIGSASVNLVLDTPQAVVGQELSGTIFIEGGNVDTRIHAVNVVLNLETQIGDDTIERQIDQIPIARDLHLREGESLSFPFSYVVPELPPSSLNVTYKFMTQLDIPGAVDKYDFDELVIYPRREQAFVLDAITALGLEETPESGYFDGVYQNFIYRPIGGEFYGRLDAMEIVFLPTQDGVQLHVVLDKHGHGMQGFFEEQYGFDTWFATLYLPNYVLNNVDQAIQALINFLETELRNPRPNRYPTLQGAFLRRGNQFVAPHGYYEQQGNAYGHSYGNGNGSGVGTFIAGAAVGYAFGELIEREEQERAFEVYREEMIEEEIIEEEILEEEIYEESYDDEYED